MQVKSLLTIAIAFYITACSVQVVSLELNQLLSGYKVGWGYKFSYQGYVSKSVLNPHGHRYTSEIRFISKVDLEIFRHDIVKLKLNSIRLYQDNRPSKDGKAFAKGLAAYPTYFQWIHGQITAIYTNKHEPEWVLNVKRGIISGFILNYIPYQTQYSISESDIDGTCLTNYTINTEKPGLTTVTKFRDVTNCKGRILSSSCTFDDIGRKNCKDHFQVADSATFQITNNKGENGIIKRSIRREKFTFVPFSKDKGSVVVETRRVFKYFVNYALKHDLSELYKLQGYRHQSLAINSKIFRHHERNTKFQFLKIDRLLSTIERDLASSQLHVPESREFFNLIDELKLSGHQNLQYLIQRRYSRHSFKRSLLLKALPIIGTDDAATAIFHLMTESDTVPYNVQKQWLAALSFMSRPTAKTIKTITTLCRKKPYLRTECTLTLGSIIHTLYKNQDELMDYELPPSAYHHLIKSLEDGIKNNQEKEIMLGLKAIANAGLPATIRALVRCMVRCPSTETRTMAIYALWRIPAQSIPRELISFLADLYEDKTNAIELRIAAFVMMMETNCLESDLRRIELTLRNESNSYVGSFLHSYLQSLAKSKSQSAHRRIALAKYALNFTKKFNSNQQSSKGFHHAIYSTAWKVGLSLNSQLIYESDSKIPRVIKANFNFELFGRRINGFEFGVRIQNLDSILIDILQRHQNRYLPLVNHEQNNEILYGRQDETSKAKLCSKVAEPKLSSYSVVYGREIQFQHFNQDQIKGLMTGLLSNQGININIDQIPTSFSCHVQLVTGLGFPLKIYQDGMTVSSLRISTAYNVLKQKMSLRTTPSIDTHIQSKVFIDATIFQTGFQMNNYLSNHMDVSTLIQPDNFGKMHISFRFPQSKSKKSQDIPFDLSTNLDSFYTQSADSRRLSTTYICIINGKASSEENNCLFIPVLCPLSYSAKMVGSSPILGPTRTKLAMRSLNELGVNLDFSVKCHPVQRYCNIFLRTTSQSKPISQILHTFEANIKLDASTQDQLDVTLTFPNSSVGAQRMRLTLPMHMDPLSLRLPPLKPGCFARNWTDWTNCSTSRPCSRGVRSRFQTISCNNNIASCQPRVEEMSCMNCECNVHRGIYTYKRSDYLCKSIKKVPQCQTGCLPAATQKTTVQMLCKTRRGYQYIEVADYRYPIRCGCNKSI